MLASGSTRVSKIVASLPQRLQRQFPHTKAFYRFLDNNRIGTETIIKRICQESARHLEEGEVLVCMDLSPVKKLYAQALEELHPVIRDKTPGYELLTYLGVDASARLALSYAHLAYGEKGFIAMGL